MHTQGSVEKLHKTLDTLKKAIESSDYERAKKTDLACIRLVETIIKSSSNNSEIEQLASFFYEYSKVIEIIELKKKDTYKKMVEFNTNQKKLQKYKHG